jgi:hypothetical protein
MDRQDDLRKHLVELFDGRSAHIDLKSAVDGFPLGSMNKRIAGSPHTAWELLEHIRIAQWDILEFSRDPGHVSPEFPDGYWNKAGAAAEDWRRSVEQIISDSLAMRDMIMDTDTDLLAPLPHGAGQTLLRECLVLADHNAYHLGQLMLLRRMAEASGE